MTHALQFTPRSTTRTNRFAVALLATLLALVLGGCGGGGGTAAPAAALSGFVTDAAGSGGSLAVADATVRAIRIDTGATVASTTTDAAGRYRLRRLPLDAGLRIAVIPPAPQTDNFGNVYRYFGTTRQLTFTVAAENRIDFGLGSARGYAFNPSAAVTLGTAGTSVSPAAAQVDLPAGALVRSGGTTAPAGNVTALVQPIDVSTTTGSATAAGLDAFPGDMLAVRADDSPTSIASFGAMTVEFFDTDGTALQLAAGQTATIRIPVPAALQATAPATIPLWWFNTATGLWEEEGTATLAADSSYYEGNVSHFTTWNADIPITVAQVSGEVHYADGSPAAGAVVRLTGVDYGYQRVAVLDANGRFSLPARRGYSINVNVTYGDATETFLRGPVPDAATFDTGTLTLAGGAPDPTDTIVERTFTVGATDRIGLYLAPGTVVNAWELLMGADLEFYVDAGALKMGVPFEHGPGTGTADGTYGLQYITGTSFTAMTTAPATGYNRCLPWDSGCPLPYDISTATLATDVFVGRTSSGFYGKLVVASASVDVGGTWTVTVRYRMNLAGTRAL